MDITHEDDGFRVVTVYEAPYLSLNIRLYQGGRVSPLYHADGLPVWGWNVITIKDPTDADRGHICRMRLLADAVCRFFNTGGTQDELNGVCDDFFRVLRGKSPDLSHLVLLDSHATKRGYQHTFVTPDNKRVRVWLERKHLKTGTRVDIQDMFPIQSDPDVSDCLPVIDARVSKTARSKANTKDKNRVSARRGRKLCKSAADLRAHDGAHN